MSFLRVRPSTEQQAGSPEHVDAGSVALVCITVVNIIATAIEGVVHFMHDEPLPWASYLLLIAAYAYGLFVAIFFARVFKWTSARNLYDVHYADMVSWMISGTCLMTYFPVAFSAQEPCDLLDFMQLSTLEPDARLARNDRVPAFSAASFNVWKYTMWTTAGAYLAIVFCTFWWRLLGTTRRFPRFTHEELDAFLVNCMPEEKLRDYEPGSAVLNESRASPMEVWMRISFGVTALKGIVVLVAYSGAVATRFDIASNIFDTDLLFYSCCCILWFSVFVSVEPELRQYRRGHWAAVLGTWTLVAVAWVSTVYLDSSILARHWTEDLVSALNVTGESLNVTTEFLHECGYSQLPTVQWCVELVWEFLVAATVFARALVCLAFHFYHVRGPWEIWIPNTSPGKKRWIHCPIPYRFEEDYETLVHWAQECREDMESLLRSLGRIPRCRSLSQYSEPESDDANH